MFCAGVGEMRLRHAEGKREEKERRKRVHSSNIRSYEGNIACRARIAHRPRAVHLIRACFAALLDLGDFGIEKTSHLAHFPGSPAFVYLLA